MKKSVTSSEYQRLSDAARTSLSTWMASHGVTAFSELSHGVLLAYLQEHFGGGLWRLEHEDGEWCVWSKGSPYGDDQLFDGRWFSDPIDALWNAVCAIAEQAVDGE